MDVTSNWLSSHPVSRLFSFRNFHVLLLLLTGAAAMLFLVQAVRLLPVTGENVYPESAGVLAAQHWARGGPLYGDYRQPPYLMTAFPPLWYAFLAGAAKIGITDLNSLTLLGRFLSLASLFGVAVLGYRWNRRLGFSGSMALLMPAIYLSFPVLLPWVVTARPDLPALFLGFLSLYWVSLRPTPSRAGLGGAVAALAFLTKHSAVAIPISIVVWLLWRKRWKQAGLYCVAWGVVAGTTLLMFQISSHGLLMLNLSGAKFGQFALTYVRDVLNRLLVPPGHGFALVLVVFGVFGLVESYRQSDERTGLLNLYLVISFALSVLGSAAAGAAVNYYLEPALAMAVLVPTALAYLKAGWRNESPLSTFVFVIVLVMLLPSLDEQRSNTTHLRSEDLRRVVALVENRQVFTDIPYLAARTQTPQSIDLASLLNTERNGGWAGWSSKGIARNLQEKKYDLVILVKPVDEWPYNPTAYYPRWPRLDSAVQNAIERNYRFCFELDASYIYGPLSHEGSPGSDCPVLKGISRAESRMQSPTERLAGQPD